MCIRDSHNLSESSQSSEEQDHFKMLRVSKYPLIKKQSKFQERIIIPEMSPLESNEAKLQEYNNYDKKCSEIEKSDRTNKSNVIISNFEKCYESSPRTVGTGEIEKFHVVAEAAPEQQHINANSIDKFTQTPQDFQD
eukprot:TRINITY_DN15744_c0_g1_i2.p2 TRINITY_DN15744_c0_g1~~TRINITY_DN15744_c0_g1_i2.p2  ORF type:complete len:137 (+),score=19.90 TRINITY_DN15744_c0_g1_i2:103-513(+)